MCFRSRYPAASSGECKSNEWVRDTMKFHVGEFDTYLPWYVPEEQQQQRQRNEEGTGGKLYNKYICAFNFERQF